MTPADLRKMIESKAIPPIAVDWLWLDLELVAPETPNAETTASVQAKLDAWAYEFASAGGQIGWEQFRRLNEMSRAAFIRAGRKVRGEMALDIATTLAAINAPDEPPPESVPKRGAVDGAGLFSADPVPPEPDPEPTVEDFTPIGSEPNAAGQAPAPTAKTPVADPPVVGAALDSALDYAEHLLRGEG